MANQTTPSRSIFVNLSVRDLNKSKEFFTKLGFEFNPQFTNDQGACMVLGKEAYVMLLVESFFQSFTKKGVCDARQHTEVINAVSCTSRAEVDEILKKALASGAKPAMPAQDHGFMYSISFYDIDDHHWEFVWMDPAAIQ